MDALINKYIEMRDAKAALKKKFTADTEKLDEIMTKIEGFILEHFNETGVESARCAGGTAYKSVRTSATVADWDATLAYIKTNDLWNMLDKRVNKTAVDEFKTEHNDLPPGINWREEIIVNIRRA